MPLSRITTNQGGVLVSELVQWAGRPPLSGDVPRLPNTLYQQPDGEEVKMVLSGYATARVSQCAGSVDSQIWIFGAIPNSLLRAAHIFGS